MPKIKRLAIGLAAFACVTLGKVVLGAFLASAALAYLVVCAGSALETAPSKFKEHA